MTPEQMQARSQQKVKQVFDLMKLLHLKVEARERITEQGFIERIVFWVDDEQYPSATPEPAGEKAQEETAETTKEETVTPPEDVAEVS